MVDYSTNKEETLPFPNDNSFFFGWQVFQDPYRIVDISLLSPCVKRPIEKHREISVIR